jgi:hypothetical protein
VQISLEEPQPGIMGRRNVMNVPTDDYVDISVLQRDSFLRFYDRGEEAMSPVDHEHADRPRDYTDLHASRDMTADSRTEFKVHNSDDACVSSGNEKRDSKYLVRSCKRERSGERKGSSDYVSLDYSAVPDLSRSVTVGSSIKVDNSVDCETWSILQNETCRPLLDPSSSVASSCVDLTGGLAQRPRKLKSREHSLRSRVRDAFRSRGDRRSKNCTVSFDQRVDDPLPLGIRDRGLNCTISFGLQVSCNYLD